MSSIVLAQSGSITNINPAQRTDGSMIVDIYYDLAGPEPAYTITVEASFDGGATFTPADSVSGDAGAGVTPGTGKHIVCKLGAEFPGQFTNQGQVRLTASLVLPWNCGDPFTDPRDNQEYATVQIGTQCWMAENLNIGTMITGASNQTNNAIIEKYCYDNSAANCDVYGGLYQWNEMMQYVTTPGVKGICPDGWHLPTDAEYCTLTQFIDPTVNCGVTGWSGTDVGTKMKSTTGWYGGGNGTNASGFTALPGGYRNPNGLFNYLTYDAFFWSSSESGTNAWYRSLSCIFATVYRGYDNKGSGFSVRCEKD